MYHASVVKSNFLNFRLIFYSIYSKTDILYIMFKIIILSIVCFAIVNGNIKDDIKDKATDALNQGEKLKV